MTQNEKIGKDNIVFNLTNFVSLEMIEKWGLFYSKEQLCREKRNLSLLKAKFQFESWPFVVRQRGYALIAGPPTEMSLADIRELKIERFPNRNFRWQRLERVRNFPFFRTDKVKPGWLVFRQRNLFCRSFFEQERILGIGNQGTSFCRPHFDCDQKGILEEPFESEYIPNIYIPNIAEVVWCLIALYEFCDFPITGDCYRTSSLLSHGDRAAVGLFCEGKIHIQNEWDFHLENGLGCCSVIDLQETFN